MIRTNKTKQNRRDRNGMKKKHATRIHFNIPTHQCPSYDTQRLVLDEQLNQWLTQIRPILPIMPTMRHGDRTPWCSMPGVVLLSVCHSLHLIHNCVWLHVYNNNLSNSRTGRRTRAAHGFVTDASMSASRRHHRRARVTYTLHFNLPVCTWTE